MPVVHNHELRVHVDDLLHKLAHEHGPVAHAVEGDVVGRIVDALALQTLVYRVLADVYRAQVVVLHRLDGVEALETGQQRQHHIDSKLLLLSKNA